MGLFKYINLPVFLVSLCLGIFAVYITLPDMRKVYVYPTPENIDALQVKDNTDTCFSFSQKEVSCPKDESKISRVVPQ